MTYAEIWNLPTEERFRAFVERYKDLDEHTGNRSAAGREEMHEIANMLMPELIRIFEWAVLYKESVLARRASGEYTADMLLANRAEYDRINNLGLKKRERGEAMFAALEKIGV